MFTKTFNSSDLYSLNSSLQMHYKSKHWSLKKNPFTKVQLFSGFNSTIYLAMVRLLLSKKKRPIPEPPTTINNALQSSQKTKTKTKNR